MKAMLAPSSPMTVEQFRALPEPTEGYYELHHGIPVFMTRPKHKHWAIQHQLLRSLVPLTSGRGMLASNSRFVRCRNTNCGAPMSPTFRNPDTTPLTRKTTCTARPNW
jgi:Uma2 family endonuclease